MKLLIKALKVSAVLITVILFAIILLFGHSDIPLNELKASYANAESEFLPLNSMEVHYRDEGNPADSIPIVLIHGTASSLHTFDAWTKNLKKTNRVIRLDLPAFGLTGPFADRDYSMGHYSAFLKDFLNLKGIKQCILAGNSLGGQIAWNFTLEQPQMVQKLILIDAAGYPSKAKSVPIAFKLGQTPVFKNILTYITPRSIVKSSIENVYHDTSKVTDSLIDRYFELTLREGNRQAFVDRLNMEGSASRYAEIKNIQQPTLILWGAEDLLIPKENALRFQSDLQNSTLVIMENTGHTPMEESPSESLSILTEFLN